MKTLRQSSLTFRILGILALVVSIVAGIGMASAAEDFSAIAASAGVMVLIVYGIGAAIGCFATGALFDRLATMTELLARER